MRQIGTSISPNIKRLIFLRRAVFALQLTSHSCRVRSPETEAECKPVFCPPERPDCYTAVTALTKDLGYLLPSGGGRDM